MTLAATQAAFMAQILAEDGAMPPGWDARFADGLAIYRNAYRARLVDALRETFPRTAEWVGEEAFRAAAAHHLISSPPSGWTLDGAGEGFVAVLGELFANDPEVEELGWLEWTMHNLFVAADEAAMDRAAFMAATSGLGDDGWMGLRLRFISAMADRRVMTRCVDIWQALARGSDAPGELTLAMPMHLLVWREGLAPVFRLMTTPEIRALARLRQGATYGDACQLLVTMLGETDAVETAGAVLARWVDDGLIADVVPPN